MATTVDTLLVRIEADMSDLRRTLRRVEQQTEQSQKKMTRSMGRMGGAIKGALGVASVAILANFGKHIVNLGSQVEEMQAKSSVVFGQFVSGVRSDLEAFGDSVGRSTHELEAMASSVQDTFVPLGFARGEAAQLSVQLTKLAVDVASFNNAQDVPTMQAFQSALVGNHEAVRRFGIVITEAELQAELFRMGIKENAADVDAQTKVQARLNLILAGTTDAHGDAARTSDSYANTSKALTAALEELLVNVVTPLLPALASMARGLVNATNKLNEFLQSIGLIEKAGDSAKAIQEDLTAVQEELAKKTLELADAQEVLAKVADGVSFSEFFESLGGGGDIDVAIGGTKRLENRVISLREEIKALKNEAALLTSDLAKTVVAPEDTSGGKKTPTKGQQKALDKVTDAISDQKFAVFQLQQEVDGLSEAHLTANEVMRGLTAITGEQSNELLALIQRELELQAVLDARTEAQKAATKAEEEAKDARQEIQQVIADLQKENERLNREIKGETHEYAVLAETLEGLTHLREQDRVAITKLVEEQFELEAALKKVREEMEKTDEMTEATLAAIQSMSTGISNALADMVMSGKFNLDSLQDVFRNFVRTMIAKAFELMVINKIMNAAFNLTGSNALPTASIPGSAGGGAISGPKIVGERGPELFVPSSTGTIKNNMDTRNILSSGQPNVVNQTINIETGVAQTVRAEVLSLMPQIRDNTIAAMVDARKRGGAIASAFGG